MDYLKRVLPDFSIFPEISKVWLFGSRARGDNQERSDIDLAIDVPSIDAAKWDSICGYVDENAETLLPIDVIWLQMATVNLRQRIVAEGVALYERENPPIS